MQIENIKEVTREGEDIFPQERPWKVYNRTGAATVVGDVYYFDTHQQAPLESVANSKGVLLPAVINFSRGANGAFGNIVAQAATIGDDSSTTQWTPGCVALQAVADNEELEVVVIGTVEMNGTIVAGFGSVAAAVQAGNKVTFANASSNTGLVVQANGTGKIIAITLDDEVWALSGTAQAARVFFNGINGVFGR